MENDDSIELRIVTTKLDVVKAYPKSPAYIKDQRKVYHPYPVYIEALMEDGKVVGYISPGFKKLFKNEINTKLPGIVTDRFNKDKE